jgi:uncharacterized delta-60 repeat protein
MRPSRHVSILSAVALMLIVGAIAPAEGLGANAGEPDPSFGNNGFTIFDEPSKTGEGLADVLVLPDGQILGAGERGGGSGFLLARFNANGTPDMSFGGEGFKVEPDLGKGGDPRAISAIEERGDGKFVVAGEGRAPVTGFNAYEFGRYLPNGELDPSFGEGGLSTVPIDEFGSAFAMDQAPGGKIVATGDQGTSASLFNLAVVRVTENGEPDASFSTVPSDGVRLIDIPESSFDEGLAVKVLGNGTVLIGGVDENGALLVELDAEGNLVPGFGKGGIAVVDLGTAPFPSGEIFDLKVLPDGRILASGDAITGSNDEEGFVARFTPQGQLDPSFAEGGIFHDNPTSDRDELNSLEIDSKGRIVASGIRGKSLTNMNDTWLLRLTPDGHLDPSFGSGGETDANVVPESEFASGLALQPDGRAVIAGDVFEGSYKLMVGRFTADPEPIKVSLVATKARCAGKNATIVGTQHADRLKGTKKADIIAGLGGNDRISSLAGNDIVCGGNGKDTIDLGKGSDEGRGEGGADTLKGGPGKDKLLGGGGKDKLLGGPGQDICNGGAGKDGKPSGCETRKKLP